MRTIIMLFLLVIIAVKAQADALDTWTNVATSAYGDFTQIAFGNGEFMAVSERTHSSPLLTGTSTSGDGLHWTTSGISSTGENPYLIDGVAFGNGTFVQSVSFGDGGAIDWTKGTNGGQYLGSPGVAQPNCVAFGNGIFAVAGFDYLGGDYGNAYVSTNGQTWSSEIMIDSNFYPTAIVYGYPGYPSFVAIGYAFSGSAVRVYDSSDGRTWYDDSPYAPVSFNRIFYVNALFTALGADGNCYTDDDVDNDPWTKVSGPAPNIYVPTSGTNGIYVSVGAAGAVYTSPDRVNWTKRTTGITNDLACIAYGDNRFVAAGTAGGIFVSGSTVPLLSVQSQSSAGTQLSLTGGLGPTYHLQASADLSSWTNLIVFTNIGTGTNYLDTTASNFTQRYYRTVSP